MRKYCERCEQDTLWRAKPERCRRCQTLKHRYEISAEQFREMAEAQGGVCKIYGEPPTKRGLFVDHCHETGMVRGLLCHGCNAGLGHLRTMRNLQSAIAYLYYSDQPRYTTVKTTWRPKTTPDMYIPW